MHLITIRVYALSAELKYEILNLRIVPNKPAPTLLTNPLAHSSAFYVQPPLVPKNTTSTAV